MKYIFRNNKTVHYQVKCFFSLASCKKFKSPTTFQVIQTLRGFYLTWLTLNLIVHIKTKWIITFSTKHSICKTPLHLNRCSIKANYFLRRMQTHAHTGTHTSKLTCAIYHTCKIIFSLFVLLLLHTFQKQKFFIEGFFI